LDPFVVQLAIVKRFVEFFRIETALAGWREEYVSGRGRPFGQSGDRGR
jgi:hypothetical protein